MYVCGLFSGRLVESMTEGWAEYNSDNGNNNNNNNDSNINCNNFDELDYDNKTEVEKLNILITKLSAIGNYLNGEGISLHSIYGNSDKLIPTDFTALNNFIQEYRNCLANIEQKIANLQPEQRSHPDLRNAKDYYKEKLDYLEDEFIQRGTLQGGRRRRRGGKRSQRKTQRRRKSQRKTQRRRRSAHRA